MKTLSVKQVADVLGVSPRAILKRLSNGQLKGTRRTNKYGVEEWWVYPNKDIRSSLEASGRMDILGSNESLSDVEVVEVDAQNFSPGNDVIDEETKEVSSSEMNPGAWVGDARGSTSGVADELWNNIIRRFLGELKERDQLIGEMRSELADKDRQLKLLPDLEKKAIEAESERKKGEELRLRAEAESERAEAERKNAEIKALEVEALKRQISALQEIPAVEKQLNEEKEAKERELQKLRSELEQARQSKEDEIKSLEEKLSSVEEYKCLAEKAQRKVDELQKSVEVREATSAEELKRLQEEKDMQTLAIKEELAALSQKIEKSQKSWWKKFFGLD
jgi:hypothetical protein